MQVTRNTKQSTLMIIPKKQMTYNQSHMKTKLLIEKDRKKIDEYIKENLPYKFKKARRIK